MKSFIGIDWSQSKHNCTLYNEHGAQLLKKEIAHTRAGFEQLHTLIQKANPNPEQCYVLIETDHNQIVDFLWDHGYALYIIAPSVVKSNRGRQTQSGARNDDSDAALLADIMRTDQGRLIRWQPDSLAVRQLRGLCGLVDDITASVVRYHNRLDALLRRYYPQACVAFKDLTVPTWLAWLQAHPSPEASAEKTYTEFEQFCCAHGHRRRAYLAQAWVQLQQPALTTVTQQTPLATEEIEHVTGILLQLVNRKQRLLNSIDSTFNQHADASIFRSVPGAGVLLSAKLLAMFGDQRTRWPTAEAIRCTAGTCPATSQSGRSKATFFRRACNHQYRHTMQQLALQSVKQSDWAATYYAAATARGHSASHAYRCLANRWLGIIWALWQRRDCYDEAIHIQNVSKRRRGNCGQK